MRADIREDKVRLSFAGNYLAENEALRAILKHEKIEYTAGLSSDGTVLFVDLKDHRKLTNVLMQWRAAMTNIFVGLDDLRDHILERKV